MKRKQQSQNVGNGRRRKPQQRRTRDPKGSGAKGVRYTEKFKKDCLKLLSGGMTKVAVKKRLGVSELTLGRWEKRYGLPRLDAPRGRSAAAAEAHQDCEAGTGGGEGQPGGPLSSAPHDNIAGLAQKEVDEILKLKKAHFTMGPAQIRAQLKRFRGWRLSVKAIARALKAHGYQVEHRSARDEQSLMRFEAPHPNALWMMDALSFRVHEQRLYLHLIIDDFSRFIVAHAVSEEITAEEAVATLQTAIAQHGKPERMLTDRGGQFVSLRGLTAFGRFLQAELIDHSVSRAYHPQTLGKVESVNRAIQKELLYLHELRNAEETRAKVAAWVEHFNYRRAHLGIDGLVPADRYFGLQARAIAEVQARSRGRVAGEAGSSRIQGPLDDLHGPLELLRFVLLDGQLEMRFCGLRFVLGSAAK